MMHISVEVGGVVYEHKLPGPFSVKDFGQGRFKNIVNERGINYGRFPQSPGATMFIYADEAKKFCDALNNL